MNTMETPTVAVADLLAEAAWARRLARSLLRDRDEAEDVLQETWLSALRRPPSAGGPLRPWLGRVLRNQAINHRTAQGRRTARENIVASDSALAPSPETLLERMQAQKLLAEAVTALKEPYRSTVLLHYYEGLSSAEVGRRMGVPAGTVRWRLKNALDQLRDTLDQQAAGDRAGWRLLLLPLGTSQTRNARSALVRAALLGVMGSGVVVLLARDRVNLSQLVASTAAPRAAADERADPPATDDPTGHSRALAANSSTCLEEVERLRKEVAMAEPEAMRTISKPKLFARGAPNPAAEKEFAPILARIMKGDHATAPAYTLECRTWVCKMSVAKTPEEATPERTNAWMRPLQGDPDVVARECRGLVCRVSAPSTNTTWLARLRSDRELMRKQDGGSFGHEVHFRMKSDERRAAERWLRTLLERFLQGPVVDTCAKKHAAAGLAMLFLKVSATEANEDGATDRLSFGVTGPLADTAFSTCLVDEARRTLLETRRPAHIASGIVHERLQLPRTAGR